MSAPAQAPSLVRRIAGEYRGVLLPLIIAIVLNILAYAFVVYPLSQQVANVAQRDRAAEQALAAARREHAQASGTLTGKDRAAAELERFYTDVLPASLAGARRLTHLRLPQLARQSEMTYVRSVYETVERRDSTLTRLQIRMELAGNYGSMRTFLHQLEIAPEFVVIDNVELSEDAIEGGLLTVSLEFSTYYRDGPR